MVNGQQVRTIAAAQPLPQAPHECQHHLCGGIRHRIERQQDRTPSLPRAIAAALAAAPVARSRLERKPMRPAVRNLRPDAVVDVDTPPRLGCCLRQLLSCSSTPGGATQQRGHHGFHGQQHLAQRRAVLVFHLHQHHGSARRSRRRRTGRSAARGSCSAPDAAALQPRARAENAHARPRLPAPFPRNALRLGRQPRRRLRGRRLRGRRGPGEWAWRLAPRAARDARVVTVAR